MEDVSSDYAKAYAAERKGDSEEMISFQNKYENTTTHSGIHSVNEQEKCVTGYHDPANPDCDWHCFCDDSDQLASLKKTKQRQMTALTKEMALIDLYLEV